MKIISQIPPSRVDHLRTRRGAARLLQQVCVSGEALAVSVRGVCRPDWPPAASPAAALRDDSTLLLLRLCGQGAEVLDGAAAGGRTRMLTNWLCGVHRSPCRIDPEACRSWLDLPDRATARRRSVTCQRRRRCSRTAFHSSRRWRESFGNVKRRTPRTTVVTSMDTDSGWSVRSDTDQSFPSHRSSEAVPSSTRKASPWRVTLAPLIPASRWVKARARSWGSG